MKNKSLSCGPLHGVVGQCLDKPLSRLLNIGIYFDNEKNHLGTDNLSMFCVYPDGSTYSKISLDGDYSLQDLHDIITVVRALSGLPNPERLPGGTTTIDTNQQPSSAAPVDRVVGQPKFNKEKLP